jgi:xanthine dehydrogenase small subunit
MYMVVNQNPVDRELNPGQVALDFLRAGLGLTGVKEGCREGDCGACTILLGRTYGEQLIYQSVVSCLLPLGDCAGKHLVTIEGLNTPALNPVQQAFVDQGAVQCGFCTPGLIVALTGYLLAAENWNEEEALLSIAGNICRCTGYAAIRRAVRQVLAGLPDPAGKPRVELLIGSGYLPPYFAGIPDLLAGRPAGPALPMPGAIAIAGGTDLYVQKPEYLENSPLTLLSARSELRGIGIAEDRCRIGGGTTVEELRLAPELRAILPGLPAFLRLVSSTQIRNRATVAGNLVNASPIGDLTILLLALDAEVELSDGHQSRAIPLRSFYLAYKKMDRQEEELLTAVQFTLPRPGDLFNFEKVGRREYLDIAGVNSACLLRMNGGAVEEVHLSAGGVAPVPLYLAQCCAYLRGRELDAAAITEALRVADGEIVPIDDVRGSADYKRLLLQQLLKAHFIKLLPDRFSRGIQ